MFRLANDGHGLSWHERWVALGRSLRGKKKVPYNRVLNVMRKESKSIPDHAEGAYDEVKRKHLRRQETDAHKSDRVLAEFERLKKGSLTAV